MKESLIANVVEPLIDEELTQKVQQEYKKGQFDKITQWGLSGVLAGFMKIAAEMRQAEQLTPEDIEAVNSIAGLIILSYEALRERDQSLDDLIEILDAIKNQLPLQYFELALKIDSALFFLKK
jgi:hypothetical protein